MEFYFSSFFDRRSGTAQSLKPNKNCNLTTWVAGCEPGWASAVDSSQKVDLKDSKDIPARHLDSQPCCDGFFCPRGLTCMIPCPLGSYCPRAKFNKTTGICDPYQYQLPPGKINHTCGGADIWADITTSKEVFCSAGSYCPSTTEKFSCRSGHFCRTGSTLQKVCNMLSRCDPNTSDQNLHASGIIFLIALSVILVVLYNCSDHVLAIRYERLARSRERAARSARETAQARERWKAAKEVTKKRTSGLQQQLSRTFSKKTSVKKQDGGLLPPKGSSNSNVPPNPTKNEPTNLTKMMNSIEDDPDDPQGFNFKIGDKNIKKQTAKDKLHTRSQIFKYAYGQIEKEKAMQETNKNLTFSGLIQMATDEEVRTRPTIEIVFKDLTITLKGKHKHLMRSVSGKLGPGRVSAVMGPSGAGKTTFLSALTGKLTGCYMSGLTLVNGSVEPIQSYKKIIGFVPQDDIVHGNLTVEENLRFSARCRLSSEMSKPDRVLVVERVIESLGLQAVRDSLVGTVEKRGISGGQRKRVNVGLEMVMEPSLLILDEPTSGLDSSSSNLLLKALRREALEGVNICMVVHQPSYTLYKMFDDLILLAKGGLIVYHGPVKKVEEYFGGFGMTVPDRVNPPDYYIDVLEGMVKLTSGVTVEQLPVRWMLHNGYIVPPEMMQYCDEIASSSKGVNLSSNAAAGQSLLGDTLKHKHEHIDLNILKSRDLSNRATPGILRQYRYYLGRVGKQRLRESKVQAADYMILLIAGVCLGTLGKVKDDTFMQRAYMYTVIAISLLCKIAALRSFTQDKLNYIREREGGMSSLAYFLSKDTIDHFNTIVKPLVYLSMFYFLSSLRSEFVDNYIVLLCLVYCVTGIAYIFAIAYEPGPAQLWCVLLPVVLTLVANQGKEDKISYRLGNYCYPKWAIEAFVIANAKKYSGVWLITRCGTMLHNGYDVHNWTRCLLLLLITGVGSRIIAFICLVTIVKK